MYYVVRQIRRSPKLLTEVKINLRTNMATNPFAPPPDSQVNNIKGHPPVQALPNTSGTVPKTSNSVTGSNVIPAFQPNKGKT